MVETRDTMAVAAKAATRRKVARLAFWSIVVACVVLALKLAAWYITGSVALYSDALESIVNVIASAATFWAIQVSYKPADQDHPFGHHKAEYFSAVLEGVLIVVAALLILNEVWQSWLHPVPLQQPWEGLAVNGVATVINAFWAWALIRTGRNARSPALVADGQHIMTDVVTSVGVFAGLVGAVLTGWQILDPALAVIVALNILWQGWHVIGSSMNGLMDRAVDTQEHMRIRDIISANCKGALEVHELKTRIAGRATFIEFHLVVDADMSVGASHVICDRIEDALQAEIPSVRVTIHVEPDDEAKLPKGTTAVPFA
ncbi:MULTISPECIES: cation diffusion facilitator family transporter [unclassified Mesorhizobium]|uniref:cation diffusion facilitator family transporter n=1 Tax=unclassified Mesorhizobium TaxID=325217 RepID=UPI001125F234|nr:MULTISPECIES: cation diffusion facilitator family transporter [unclassified Mesorhizobium]TPK49245.1 cation transporter [Mesorhizobium sp. B2-5-2]TPL18399.1 cation transporter [Mesorhizobium sp. B2-4-7]TPL35014.1 cation transporter [Mesorhizobium sp. B2-4-5]TPM71616.1 cation transporter [Mesorhizobium sp. B2-1-6]TPN73954.1 cation transporter [Mesorhizobium sp. B1-1-2]